MDLEKNILSINQISAEKIEVINCEGDCIVPDIKPDIYKIITSSGIVNIYKKEITDGKIRIDGAINTYTMYISDEEGKREIRSINYILDFSQVINIENAKSEMISNICTNLKKIDARMVNERKINVKAVLEIDIKLFNNSNEEFIIGINDINDLQKQEDIIIVNSLLGNSKTKVQAKETILIDNIDNLAEILKADVEIINKETKISYNKILAKSEAKLKIMYLTDDGRINIVSKNIPVMGFIDMQDISEENVCDIQYETKNMIIKPNSVEEHSIYVEIEMELTASAYQTKEINIMQDLYSPSKNLSFEQKAVKVMQNKFNYTDILSIREKQFLDIGNEKIYDADVKVEIDNIRILEDEIKLSGNININFIHTINNMQEIDTTIVSLPLEHNIKCNKMNSKNCVNVYTDIPVQDFTILSNGEIEVKLDIEFMVSTSSEIEINQICNIKEINSDKKDKYNMIIYFTKKDDTLWKIAKEFKSTIETIKKYNELENEEIKPGMQLFISKYVGVNG